MRKGLRITSFKSALWGGLGVLAILALASWAFEHGLYQPSIIQRGQVSVKDGPGRITARTRLLSFRQRSLWQFEVSPGDWRDCGNDCEQALLRALAK
jgi:hypothetical protein